MRISLALLFSAGSIIAQNPSVVVGIDVNANRKPINPRIYGVAHASTAQLSDLNAPLNRHGGNNTTRYNWQQNCDNRGFDWYFESIPDASSTPGARGDSFVDATKAAGAEPMFTIPIIDWVAKIGSNRSKLCSFSQAKYGAQTGNDWQWFPDAGNGILKSTGQEIQSNDPGDANVPNSAAFQKKWVPQLRDRGLKYYILDNEHSIWHSTHRDVWKAGATMEQIRDRILSYAAAVKEADPAAWVVGPEEWGWSGYIFSGYDQWYGSRYGWGINPDRNAHGGMDYLPWLLSQMKNVKVGVNQNLNVLDVFTVHYYPQGGEFGNDTSTSMQQRRNRSTRSLWDPAYTDESWIADKVRPIPRLKEWVQNYYIPGTPVGVTEYNWGAESHINGATAQADIYGIFGREGLDFGARWTTPDASTPTYKAMRMYRNYDGNKSTFGDVAVGVTAPSNATWDTVAPFAAQRTADGALTIMAISKYLSGSTPVTFNISNFSGAGVAQVWQLTSANSIARLADLTYANGQILTSLPQQSITLFVLPQGSPNTPPTALFSAAPMTIMTGGAVNFDGSASSDPDGSITNYAWTFGDGTSANTPGPLTAHAYAAAGTYQAKLTVMDNRGATAVSSNVTITVNPDPNIINAPSGLTGSSPARSSVKLTWLDNSTNETNFEVHRAPAGTTNFAVVATVAANVKTYQETLPRGTWLYKVRAINATTGKQSAFSNQIQIKTR